MTKLYNIFIDDRKIGTTGLEKADPPVGVVFGMINFINIPSGYDFLKTVCLQNNIEINTDYPDDKLIFTSNITNIKVVTFEGIEIKGEATNIEGMDADVFEIILSGVPYPFFEEEFPHHVKKYNDRFEDH